MKTKNLSILATSLILFTILVFQACKKDEKENNGVPVNYTDGKGEVGSSGGTITLDDASSPLHDAYVSIPANSLLENTQIEMYEIDNDPEFFGDSRIIVVGFKPHGLEFTNEIEIGVPYPEEIDTEKLSVYYYNASTEKVQQFAIKSINTQKHIVTLSTNHFSGYFAGWDGVPCPGTPTITYAGQTYPTVTAGSQCWMAENLNVGEMITTPMLQTDNGSIEKYCYNNDPSNCDTYGGLYQWDELMEYTTTSGAQGICPDGWHVPSVSDYLNYYENGYGVSFNQNVGGQYYFENGNFGFLDEAGFYWMSESNTYSAFAFTQYQEWYEAFKKDGISVRCVKDDFSLPQNGPPSTPIVWSPLNGALNQDINVDIDWMCDDPDGDPLTYDIYFGTSNPPVLVKENHNSSNYDPGTLEYNTIYYWKIVANDNNGYSRESDIWNFTTGAGVTGNGEPCPGTPTIEYGGKTYNTVLLGGQCWMKENLDIGTMIQGQENPANNGYIEKYCYDNNEYNCDTYGGLYYWNELMDYITEEGSQGICPEGWHVPTSQNFQELSDFLGGFNNSGGVLISGGGSGFEALLGGGMYSSNHFLFEGNKGTLWSSTPGTNGGYMSWSLFLSQPQFGQSPSSTEAFSVRCIKDWVTPVENNPPNEPSNPTPDNMATNIEVNTTLSWSCSDPDEDALVYDVYLGISTNPTQVGENLANTSFTTDELEENTIYFWKIRAFDNKGGSSESPLWQFKTVDNGGDAPVANFSANITSGTAPLSVNFTDQSTNNPTTWQWNFGDGSTSTQANPTHTYSTDGSYTVTLTVTNNFGSDSETKNDYITVSGGSNTPPTALFTVFPSSGTTSTNFAFDASGSTDNEDPTSNLQVRWDFDGNGSWDTGWDYDKTTNHQYSSEGSYTAKLEVKDPEGLTDEYTKNITVSNGGGTGTFTDPRDGQTYATIEIGSQTWFAENLNYETSNSWWYNNSSANGDIYGRLYTWDAALNACPTGWHLPSDDEWKTLEMVLGMSQSEADNTGRRGTDEGGKMKEVGTAHWNSPNTGATNSSGFTALPGGYRYSNGSFYSLGTNGHWWSSAEYSGTGAWDRYLYYDNAQVGRNVHHKTYGFSVRCLKN